MLILLKLAWIVTALVYHYNVANTDLKIDAVAISYFLLFFLGSFLSLKCSIKWTLGNLGYKMT